MSIRAYTTIITSLFLAVVISTMTVVGLEVQREHLQSQGRRDMRTVVDLVADWIKVPLQEDNRNELMRLVRHMTTTKTVEIVDIANERGVIIVSSRSLTGHKLQDVSQLRTRKVTVHLLRHEWVASSVVPGKNGHAAGFVNIQVPATDYYSALLRTQRLALLFGVLAILFGSCLAYAFSGYLASALSPIMAAIRSGTIGDLSRRVQPSSIDEVAQIANYYNELAATLDKRIRDTEAVNQLASKMALATSLEEITELLVYTCEAVGHKACYFWVKNPITGRLEDIRQQIEPLNSSKETIVAATLTSGKVFIVGPHGSDLPAGTEIAPGIRPQAAIVVPMIAARYGPVGVAAHLYFDEQKTPDRDAIATVLSIANVAAPAIAAIKRAAARERAAQMLSEILRPAPPPNIAGMEITTRFQPAEIASGLGGDYYDFLDLEDGSWAIVIGDVAGKGIEAAQYTGMAKHVVRSYGLEYRSPSFTLQKVNTALTAQTGEDLFITLFYAVVDLKGMKINASSAGHPAGILYKPSTGKCVLLEGGGPAVGIYKGIEYSETEEKLEPGAVLALVTDGLTEARRNGEMYEIERASKIVGDKAKASTSEIADALLNSALDFAGGRLLDDLALVIVKIL